MTCVEIPAAQSAETLPTRNVVYADLDRRELALNAEANRCRAEAIAKAHSKIEAKTVLASR